MIPKLRPGEEITPARLNQVIDAVNAAQITSSDFPLERTSAGTKLSMPRRPQDLYAKIIETEGRDRGDDGGVKDGEYEWKEVYLPGVVDNEYPPEEFEEYPDGSGLGSSYDPDNKLLYDPAYELNNDRTIPVDTLIRLRVYPGVHDDVNKRGFIRRYVFNHGVAGPALLWAEAISDWEEGGAYPNGQPQVRCYQLVPDTNVTSTASFPYPKKRTGEPFFVELPRARLSWSGLFHSADPAVYKGDLLQYTIDDQERFICQSPFLHMGRILDVRMQVSGVTGGSDFYCPTGWHECDGSTQHGNAGNIVLVNFNTNYLSIISEARYGAIPMHPSDSRVVGQNQDIHFFDAIGEDGAPPNPVVLPNSGAASTTLVAGHRHETNVQAHEYKAACVFFYERYK